MWGHVSETGLIDLLDGRAETRVRAHVDACARCRARLQDTRAGLDLAAGAPVPEPPPLYWEAFRRQVDRRLAVDPARPRFGLWPALGALLVLVAFVSVVPLREEPQSLEQPALPAWSALPPLAEDSSFGLLQGLEAAEDDLLVASGPSGVTSLVVGLSEAERHDLSEALERELQGGKS